MKRRDRFLGRLPAPLKQGLKRLAGAVPAAVRLGSRYRRWRVFLEESRRWTREELERYQAAQLERMLKHAAARVPYYRALFRRLGLREERFGNPEVLRAIPPLTRDAVLNNLEALTDSQIPRRKLMQITTGGTSGAQIRILSRPGTRAVEAAFAHDVWSRAGFRTGARLAVLRGEAVQSPRHPRTWRYDPLRRELLLSSYHLAEENLALYIEKMAEYRIKYLHCYPSAVAVLGRFLASRGSGNRPFLKAILTSSENIYPGQREFLETVFGCRCLDLYGQTEGAALAGECEEPGIYHLYPQYSFVEILDKAGNRVSEKGAEGEIVGTGFINDVMPLIRYRTGDWATAEGSGCPCGGNYPTLKAIRGRRERETIIGKHGNRIPLVAVNSHSSIYDRVKQYQFLQERPGELRLTVVRGRGYSEENTAAIREELEGKLGESVTLSIAFAPDIPRTGRGKHSFLIQKIPLESGGEPPPDGSGKNEERTG